MNRELFKKKSFLYPAAGFIVIIAAVIVYFTAFTGTEVGEFAQREITRGEAAIEEAPNDPDRRVSLALLYLETDQRKKAIEQLEAAININEEHQGAYVALGNIYLETGDYDNAILYYGKVVELNADSEMRYVNSQLEAVYYFMGTALFELGEDEEAIASLKEALVIDPMDADAWFMLGTVSRHALDNDGAVEAYHEAIRFVPNFKEAYEGLAQSYKALGLDNHALYAKTMIKYSDGKWEETISGLELVVTVDPELVPAQLGLALSYERVGDLEKALPVYKKVLRLDPHNWLAQARVIALTDEEEEKE